MDLLGRADLPTERVSLVTTRLMERPELVEELKMGDDSLHDAAIGAGLGGVVGVLGGLAVAVVAAPPSRRFLCGGSGWHVHRRHRCLPW